MLFYKLLFYIFALIMVYSAFRVITAKNPMVAVLHLVLTFLMTSALWMLLQAEFLAISLIIIYCGAVMVFFLFAVMMLDIPHDTVRDGFVKFFPMGIAVALLIIVEMALILTGKSGFFATHYVSVVGESEFFQGTARSLGSLLYSQHLFSFEMVGLILLVALIAAISLTKTEGPLKRKDVSISDQVKADPTKRVKLVSMKSAVMAEVVIEEAISVDERVDENTHKEAQ